MVNKNRKIVVITDPHIKADQDNRVYKEALELNEMTLDTKNIFIKNR